MSTLKFGTAALVVLALLGSTSAADPVSPSEPEPPPSEHLRMRDPSTLHVASGRTFLLPPGRFISERLFAEHEAELKRLQTSETRLTAERNALKKLAESSAGPGWGTVLVLAGVIATGFAVHRYWPE